MDLYEGLLNIFEEYGYYLEGLQSLTLKGIEGAGQIQGILNQFRNAPPKHIAGKAVTIQEDYQSGVKLNMGTNKEEVIDLPKSNVIKYFLEDGTWVCLRPSGTEPKIKFYFGVQGEKMESAELKLKQVMNAFMEKINGIINSAT